ncbi:hypothetical protein KSS87_014526 [Heliosperma pusillum]|nr:hypothetical protein KSS87_014526 [Heliosperma pusillum]
MVYLILYSRYIPKQLRTISYYFNNLKVINSYLFRCLFSYVKYKILLGEEE